MSQPKHLHAPRSRSSRRLLGVLAVSAAALAFTACSGEITGPDGSAVDVKVSVPDISLPSLDNNSGGDSGSNSGGGGDSGSNSGGGGDSGSNSGGGDSGSNSNSGGGTGSSNASTNNTTDGMSPLGWAVVIIGIVAAIALLLAGSNSGGSRERHAARRRDQMRRINGIVQNSRWASSQANTALTIDDPTSLNSAWSQARSYLPDIETTSASVASDVGDADLASAAGQVGQDVATLRGAMDNYVNTRVHHPRDDASARGAEQSVRQALSSLDHSTQQLSDSAIARGSSS